MSIIVIWINLVTKYNHIVAQKWNRFTSRFTPSIYERPVHQIDPTSIGRIIFMCAVYTQCGCDVTFVGSV
jgi:hypothetical protein